MLKNLHELTGGIGNEACAVKTAGSGNAAEGNAAEARHPEGRITEAGAVIPLSQVASLTPFTYGLEYRAPARGGWTIVHTGFLLPESHEVFVCAQSCLRGVVLSAAELYDSHRFSTISVDEESVLEGNCEEIIIEGVTHILEGLGKKGPLPKALLLFTSCVHHFLGTDLKLIFRELERRFPEVGFVQCWMNPVMRKTKLPPDPFMRKQLYSLLKPAETNMRQVNIIGNNLAIEGSSELYDILEGKGFSVKDICTCRTFEEYGSMSSACLNIVTHPLGRPAAKELEERLGQRWVYLPVSYDWDEIECHWRTLTGLLELDYGEMEEFLAERKSEARKAFKTLAEELKDWTVAIDYTVSARPLGMAKMLTECGFHVDRIYIDTISPEEKETLEWLKEHCPRMELAPTVYHKMAVLPRSMAQDRKVLAVGQKAAYFTGTSHFVNMVEDGGLYGYGGLFALAGLMREAAETEREAENVIQVKGWGCCC